MNSDCIRSIAPRTGKAFAAVATVGAALAFAGSALAEPSQPTAPAKKGCEVQLKGPGAGQSIIYQHGSKFSIQAQDNKTHSYTCNDGKCEETVTLTAGGTSVRRFRIVNLRGNASALSPAPLS